MGCKGSKVQILPSRPDKLIKKGRSEMTGLFYFRAPANQLPKLPGCLGRVWIMQARGMGRGPASDILEPRAIFLVVAPAGFTHRAHLFKRTPVSAAELYCRAER